MAYKQLFGILVVGFFIAPQVALAAWWNPISWSVWNIFRPAPKVQQVQVATTTVAILTATTTKKTETNRKQDTPQKKKKKKKRKKGTPKKKKNFLKSPRKKNGWGFGGIFLKIFFYFWAYPVLR